MNITALKKKKIEVKGILKFKRNLLSGGFRISYSVLWDGLVEFHYVGWWMDLVGGGGLQWSVFAILFFETTLDRLKSPVHWAMTNAETFASSRLIGKKNKIRKQNTKIWPSATSHLCDCCARRRRRQISPCTRVAILTLWRDYDPLLAAALIAAAEDTKDPMTHRVRVSATRSCACAQTIPHPIGTPVLVSRHRLSSGHATSTFPQFHLPADATVPRLKRFFLCFFYPFYFSSPLSVSRSRFSVRRSKDCS